MKKSALFLVVCLILGLHSTCVADVQAKNEVADGVLFLALPESTDGVRVLRLDKAEYDLTNADVVTQMLVINNSLLLLRTAKTPMKVTIKLPLDVHERSRQGQPSTAQKHLVVTIDFSKIAGLGGSATRLYHLICETPGRYAMYEDNGNRYPKEKFKVEVKTVSR